jgi:hypothetical protein
LFVIPTPARNRHAARGLNELAQIRPHRRQRAESASRLCVGDQMPSYATDMSLTFAWALQ